MARDTRDRILDGAARLFETHGFDGTAVSAILREAGVNSGSLYHFFPSKEALLVSVLDRYVESLGPMLLEAAAHADGPVERVFALIELYRGRLCVSGCTRGCPVGDLALDVGGRPPEARERIDAYFRQWTGAIHRWLDDAGDRLPGRVDRSELARHVLSLVQGAVMQAKAAASIEPFDASVSQLRMYFGLLEAEGGAVGTAGDRGPGRDRTKEPRAAGKEAPAPDAEDGIAAGEIPRAETVPSDEAAWWRAW